ncbi:glycoside hydrolase family 35 protein [Diaminobutyricibacter sp. McL0608]|uniref:glycoside hydrolase family 35 protein n=1 Tax=Leifsonia sp. McL0608 TaxID=3143537 RepID=UPI0031F3124A
MSTFEIAGDQFLLDGQPFQIISGAIHYFRVHPDLWADRIRKARLMGLNTVETYVPWNLHEPKPGEWNWSGGADLERFLDTVAAEGMRAIVRPGPYICAEWDNGGFPAWLFADPAVGVRRDEPHFMAAVERFLERTLAIVEPRQVSQSGPVILVQVENEYGAYGHDTGYLGKLAAITRSAGITVPLTTVDQPQDDMLENGSLPGVLKTASFGSRSTERLEALRRHQPTGPLMCSEFWNGWFDSWGGHHHVTDAAQTAADLDDLLGAGASVNLYMFHGGTNFGFTNGANDKGIYKPIVTSYDYDAPLDEAGNPTEKFWAFREVIARHAPVPAERPALASLAPELTASLTTTVPLHAVEDRLGDWVSADALPSFDAVGHFGPLAVYATPIEPAAPAVLDVSEVRDRATVFVGDTRVGVLARDHHERAITVPAGAGTLRLLVEDLGRVDYGNRIGEAKGLIGAGRLGGSDLGPWAVLPLDLGRFAEITEALDSGDPVYGGLAGPAFARGEFTLDEAADLFLDTSGWGKGVAWVNGFALGRYWSRGPQRTLYVPRPVVRAGVNEVTILELDAGSSPAIRFVSRPELGHCEE